MKLNCCFQELKIKMKKIIKNILIILFSLLIIFLLLLTFFQKENYFKLDLSQNNIIYIALLQEDSKICNKINESVIRDSCFLQFKECSNINNYYLKYQCNRLYQRIHMFTFISKANELQEFNFNNSNICNGKNTYSKLVCIYYNALLKSHYQNINDGDIICKNIDNKLYSGECAYYLIIPHMLSINDKEKILELFDHCSKIENPSWRSECYFLIADELVLLEDVQKYFEDIKYACINSNNARDYNCIDHTAVYIKNNLRKTYCDSFDKLNEREECYVSYGYGKKINDEIDFNEFLNRCHVLDNEYNEACYSGIMWQLKDSLNNSNKFVLNCNYFPEKYRDKCYRYYGQFIFKINNLDNYSGMINHCLYVDDKYIQSCYLGLGSEIYFATDFNYINSINICNNTLYEEFCFKGIIESVKYISYNISQEITKCNLFPNNFIKKCTKLIKNER
jgi:hypothetical protein